MKVVKIILIVLGGLIVLFGLAGVFLPGANLLGGVLIAVLGLGLIAIAFFTIKEMTFFRNAFILLTVVYFLAGGSVSAMMIFGTKNYEESWHNWPTVIVLGAKIEQNGEPSPLLKARLDAAIEFLKSHRNSNVIVTGGKGADEPEPEGIAMQRYLFNNGIAYGRMFVDDMSTNTESNIKNAAKIIQENNLHDFVVIASDDFHQYRAQFYARKNNLNVAGIRVNTLKYLVPYLWAREIPAIAKAYIG